MQRPAPISAARFRTCRLLLNKKHRLESGLCLIEGKRFVAEALDRPGVVECLLVSHRIAAAEEISGLLRGASRAGAAAYAITEKQLGELSDTVASQGVLAVVRLPAADPSFFLGLTGTDAAVVALDGIADPGNLGTIIRTCAWFGVDGVILSERTVELSNPKLLRSTMGAVFRVPVAAGVGLPEFLPAMKGRGFRVLAAEAGGEPAERVLRAGGRRLLVFGSEAHGISPAVRVLADGVFGIAGSGLVESLNVSVAVGIALNLAFTRTEFRR